MILDLKNLIGHTWNLRLKINNILLLHHSSLNDADSNYGVFSPPFQGFHPTFWRFSPYFNEILLAVSRFLEFTRSA